MAATQPKNRNAETRDTLCYPLYTGFTFPETPFHFKQPSCALSWALSRFKKDGLGNAWFSSLQSFVRFVGVTRVAPMNSKATSLCTNSRSSLEETFLSDVISMTSLILKSFQAPSTCSTLTNYTTYA